MVHDAPDAIDDEREIFPFMDTAVVAKLDRVVLSTLPVGALYHHARAPRRPTRWRGRRAAGE
jgi:hypothetical protein